MNILITGGLGFIPSHLVERLINEGNTVVVLDDYSNGIESNIESVKDKVHIINGDVSSRDNVMSLNIHMKYDIIYFLSCHPRSFSMEDPIRDWEVNGQGMLNIIELAQKSDNAKIIYSSNSGIYDTSDLPINELSLDKPTTPYDAHKLIAEQYLEIFYDNYTIFRFGTVYGDRQLPNEELGWRPLIACMCEKVFRGLPVTVDGDGTQTRDLVFVDDVVDALMLAKTHSAKGPMILGTGVETSVNDVVSILSTLVYEEVVCKKGERATGDIDRMQYDCEKVFEEIGWRASTSLKDGLRKTLEWWKNENNLQTWIQTQ